MYLSHSDVPIDEPLPNDEYHHVTEKGESEQELGLGIAIHGSDAVQCSAVQCSTVQR
jgi:hypothetical protein